MWQRFTERARRMVFLAQEEAARQGTPYVGTEHLLLGLLRVPEAVSGMILERLGAPIEPLRAEVERRMQPLPAPTPVAEPSRRRHRRRDMELTPAAKQAVDLAYEEARQLNHNYIGGEHLLLGLMGEGEGLAGRVLREKGLTPERVRAEIENPLLSLDEAARFLGISRPTLYRLIHQGDLKGLKAGRQWRFNKFDLMLYMQRGPVATAAAPTEMIAMELAYFTEQLQQAGATVPALDDEIVDTGERNVAHLLDLIGALAIHTGASDIHLEPVKESADTYLLLRFRQDGALHEIRRLPMGLYESLLLGAKQRTGMDMNEKRLPQNGRLLVPSGDREFELLLATIPTLFGEAVTVRILDRNKVLLPLEKIGFPAGHRLREWIHRPNGLILIAGPAGSGKDTLLYSCIHEIAAPDRKVITVEETVEFLVPHTTPIESSKKGGLTIAGALRALWWQDPDVLMVRSLEESEPARLAAEFALTGHLVLATLNANSAADTVKRLLDMEVEPLLLARTLVGVVSQRLARKICSNCKEPVETSLTEPTLAHIRRTAAAGGYTLPAEATFYRGRGCEQCRQTGYKGRVPLIEFLEVTPPLADAVLRRGAAEELAALAIQEGMVTLFADGIRKAAEGQTTLDEALRASAISAPIS